MRRASFAKQAISPDRRDCEGRCTFGPPETNEGHEKEARLTEILAPLLLSIQLALASTLVLIVIGTPLAWCLAESRSRFKPILEAIVAMPIVLPPTVMGFYLLLLLGPHGPVGSVWLELTGETLTFHFSGLLIASVLYSFPFVVQPLQSAFEAVPTDLVEAAQTLGASRFDAFTSITLPMSRRGFSRATIMGIAHTLGEFGVVLMVGGNIPGETRLISIAIYDHVETLEYGAAHALSALLLAVAFAFMLLLYGTQRRSSP
jgi:molybdate transport system permease protein